LATPQLSVTGQAVMRTACYEEEKKKGGKMPLFTIMHIYEVPARNQYEATNELMTARKHNFDKVYLKKVLVKDADHKPLRTGVENLKQELRTKPKRRNLDRMVTIFRRQVFGK
jgi:hypothetical protein